MDKVELSAPPKNSVADVHHNKTVTLIELHTCVEEVCTMSYTLIKGEFHIFYPDIPRQGPEPDGDTVKFRPDNPILVERLERPGGIGPDFNGRNMINLRLEGIDALETHFDDMHQNLELALAARDALLQRLG